MSEEHEEVQENYITMRLRTYVDEGLQSTNSANLTKIKEIANNLGVSVQRVKNFIGNERRRRRKREPTTGTVPPTKMRKPNGYNLYVGEFFKSEGGKQIESFVEKNKIAAEKWRNLDHSEKQQYFKTANEIGIDPFIGGECSSWREVRRMLANMKTVCEWGDKVQDVEVFYVVTHKNQPYVGGTEMGRRFLEENPCIPISFMTSSSKFALSNSVKDWTNRKELKEKVTSLLNCKYALAVDDSTRHVPYSSLTSENVTINGQPFLLKHPSAMTMKELRHIFNNIEALRFVDVPPSRLSVNIHMVDHTYCTTSPQDSNINDKANSMIGHTTLSCSQGDSVPPLFNTA